MTVLQHTNNRSSNWWCETFILALRRDDEASRHQHQPSNQPCYRPGEVRQCADYSGEEEKEATSLFHKLPHSNFSTSWGARKTMLIKGSQLSAFCPQAIVYCYHEFKLPYLKNQNLFSIRVKELFEPIVLRKKGDGFLLFL